MLSYINHKCYDSYTGILYVEYDTSLYFSYYLAIE